MTDPVAVPALPAVPTTPAVPPFSQAAAPAPVPLPRRRNTIGIGAFIFGLLAFLSPAIGVIGGFALIGEAPNAEGLNLFNVLFFGAIGAGVGCAVGLIAIVLGFVSLAIKNAKRMWGVLGLVLGFLAVFIGWIPLVAWITSGGNSGPTGVPLNG